MTELEAIAAFMEARLAEEEAAANEAARSPGKIWNADSQGRARDNDGVLWDEDNAHVLAWFDGYLPAAIHAARHDPASTLRDVEADRNLLLRALQSAERTYGGDWTEGEAGYTDGKEAGLLLAVKIRAERFSSHPGYLEEWRPW